MGVIEIAVPQLGEGLQEVFIRQFLKQPGERIKRDEPIYCMETDKALMDVESPQEGILQEWLVKESDIVSIGSPIARIATEVSSSVVTRLSENTDLITHNFSLLKQEASQKQQSTHPLRKLIVPPRTLAYCRQVGISEEEMHQIPTATGKLMPKDVDNYLSEKEKATFKPSKEKTDVFGYAERPVSSQQRSLIYRLKRSAQLVIPATIARSVEWDGIQRVVQNIQQQNSLQISEFQAFAYCVAQASKDHPKFRSTLVEEHTIREYEHLNMGFAVTRPHDELVTAVVPSADSLDFFSLVRAIKSQIRKACKSGDGVTESTQLLLTYMGSYDITSGSPVLFAPAVAVLFIGTPYVQDKKLLAQLALTFDHRLINGVGAAKFLNTIVQQVEQLEANLSHQLS